MYFFWLGIQRGPNMSSVLKSLTFILSHLERSLTAERHTTSRGKTTPGT